MLTKITLLRIRLQERHRRNELCAHKLTLVSLISLTNATQRMDNTRSSPPPVATTRRQTVASQKRSHKKLSAPFRSPLMKKTSDPKPSQDSDGRASGAVLAEPPASDPETISSLVVHSSPCKSNSTPAKILTKLALSSRAAAQFKSPFAARGESHRAVVLPTPTIQALERRATVLKRAIKIQRDGDKGKLAELAVKWREAAREAAYELWAIFRDSASSQVEVGRKSEGWGWGWDDKKDEGEMQSARGSQGDVDADEHKEVQEETLGIMLRKMGIDPETLGWSDDQEAFVD